MPTARYDPGMHAERAATTVSAEVASTEIVSTDIVSTEVTSNGPAT